MSTEERAGTWRELGRYGGVVVALAGGVLVSATSIYVAASLLPTAVAEIGGQPLYAWTMTAFLIAQVVGTSLVPRALAGVGGRRAALFGLGIFAVGSVVCAVGPAMAVLLGGRAVQGVGAGLLTGLGFALVRTALPARLWGRGVALVSAMFGVGNIVGPAMGGLFAQFGSWRLAFVALAAAALVLAGVVLRALPAAAGAGGAAPVPVVALTMVVATAAAISAAGLFSGATAVGWLAVGVAFGVGFVVVERRSDVRLLPRSTYRGASPLRWIYLTIMLLAAGVAVELFLPLFAQDLGGLPPAAAGVFAAALSLGWSLTQLGSAAVTRPAAVRALLLGGPACLATGFVVLAVLMRPDPSTALVLGWLPIVVGAGAGIGAALPHLSVAAMSIPADPDEAGQAAAGIATVLTMATALGAAVAGLLVNLGAPDVATSARLLLFGFAVIAALGVATAWRATIGATRASSAH